MARLRLSALLLTGRRSESPHGDDDIDESHYERLDADQLRNTQEESL